jgi:hypothetical protein
MIFGEDILMPLITLSEDILMTLMTLGENLVTTPVATCDYLVMNLHDYTDDLCDDSDDL